VRVVYGQIHGCRHSYTPLGSVCSRDGCVSSKGGSVSSRGGSESSIWPDTWLAAPLHTFR
jgi:hypothetical protein